MSLRYLYAFTERLPPCEARGLWGEPLLGVDLGGVTAICGATEAPPPLTPGALRGHDRVVRLVGEHGDGVLPLRFGQTFRGERSLREAIAPLAARLHAALAHVAGCEQMTLRLYGEEPSALPATTGTAYLQGLRARGSAREALLDRVRRALGDLRVDELVETGRGGLLASVYHLVPRGTGDRYREALDRLTGFAGQPVVVSGPWPPYAFVPELDS